MDKMWHIACDGTIPDDCGVIYYRFGPVSVNTNYEVSTEKAGYILEKDSNNPFNFKAFKLAEVAVKVSVVVPIMPLMSKSCGVLSACTRYPPLPIISLLGYRYMCCRDWTFIGTCTTHTRICTSPVFRTIVSDRSVIPTVSRLHV